MKYEHHDQVLIALQDTRELLKDHWSQGSYHRDHHTWHKQGIWPMRKMKAVYETTTHCLVGGLHQSIDIFADRYETSEIQMFARMALVDTISDIDIHCHSLESWNDQSGRKHSEVMAAIDRAIELVHLDKPEPPPSITPLKVEIPEREIALVA